MPEPNHGFPSITRDAIDEHLLALVLNGESTRSMARLTDLAEGTVKWRLHRIYRRAGVANRTQLVLWLHQQTEVGGDRTAAGRSRIQGFGPTRRNGDGMGGPA